MNFVFSSIMEILLYLLQKTGLVIIFIIGIIFLLGFFLPLLEILTDPVSWAIILIPLLISWLTCHKK